LPPNDVNKRFGNIVEVRVIMTRTRVIRKTPHVTRFENSDSIFLNSKICVTIKCSDFKTM